MGHGNSKYNLVAAMLGALVLLIAQNAGAYAFKTSGSGDRVRWNHNSVRIVLDSSLNSLGPSDQVEELVIAAFDEWVDAAQLPLEFSFVAGQCSSIGYAPVGNNENCVTVHEGVFEGSHAAARSFVSFDDNTGIIVDADIVINAGISNWSLDGSGSGLDLRAAVMHEVGHVLGLAHSEVEMAVMAPELETHTVVKSLFNDDIDGAQSLYDGMEEYSALNCSTATVGGGASSPMAAFILLMILGFALRNRRNSGNNLASKKMARHLQSISVIEFGN